MKYRPPLFLLKRIGRQLNRSVRTPLILNESSTIGAVGMQFSRPTPAANRSTLFTFLRGKHLLGWDELFGEEIPADEHEWAATNQTTGSKPWCAAATLSRVLFLTMYMASSARCSNCALVLASLG